MTTKSTPVEIHVTAERSSDHKKYERIHFYIVSNATALEAIQASNKLDAIAKFQAKHGPHTHVITNAFVLSKTASVQADRPTVTLEIRQFTTHTKKMFEGEYQGWTVICNGIKAVTVDGQEYDDNELLVPIVEKLVDPSVKTEKPRFRQREAIPASMIDNLREID